MQPDILEKIPLRVESLFLDMQSRVMQDVVRRIQKTGGITSTADYQIQKVTMMGNSSEFIESEIKRLMGLTNEELWAIYDEAAEKDYTRDKGIYEQINRRFIPYEENSMMQAWVKAIVAQTSNEISNITQSLGFSLLYGTKRVFTPLSEYYQKYLDRACLDIVTGTFSYNTVLRRVVKEMTASGIRTVNYGGDYSNRVEVAARRAIMTGVHQLTAKINEQVADDLGTDMYEVTAHLGARPSHQVWQGQVYSRKELESVCGLGSVTGLCGANCRHSYYAFIPGISVKTYTDEQLEEMKKKDNEVKTWHGKEYTGYAATQKQREMETKMRKQRADVKLLKEGKAASDDILAAQTKYVQTLHEYQSFSKKMTLPEQMERVYMDGLGRIAPGRVLFKLSDSTDKWAIEAKKMLIEDEKSIAKRKKEVAVVYDKNGKFLFQKSGDTKSVKFSAVEILKLRNNVVSHNHPSGASFSMQDVNLMRLTGMSELRVVVEDGVYYLRPPERWPEVIKKESAMLKELKNIQKEVRKNYQKLYENGKINKIDRYILSVDKRNQMFAEMFGFDYGKELF